MGLYITIYTYKLNGNVIRNEFIVMYLQQQIIYFYYPHTKVIVEIIAFHFDKK